LYSGEIIMSFSKQDSSGKQQSESYTPEQRAGLTKALAAYTPIIGQNPASKIYQGERVAGTNATQNNVLNQLAGISAQNPYTAAQAIPLYNQTGSTLSGILNGTTGAQPLSIEQANQTFQDTRVNPTMKNWNQNLAPSIREEYAGPGYWSSARADAVAKSGQDTADTLAAQRAGFLWDTENTNRQLQADNANRALAAVPQSMAYGQQPIAQQAAQVANLGQQYTLASTQQQQKQNEIDAAMQKFAEQNQITNPDDMNILMSLLGLNYSTSSGKTSGSGFGIGIGK
jgi:hypothetical protein